VGCASSRSEQGTGGTTAGLLPLLPADRSEYLFTDIGPTFLNKAQERFSAFPFVHYQPLNIEQEPAAQGFQPYQADLVVAANVLHATRDLGQTLAHVRQLLQPGGQLVLLEATERRRWLDLTFGLTDGWWRYADERQGHPLLSAEGWRQQLSAHGFVERCRVGAGWPGGHRGTGAIPCLPDSQSRAG
jgi:SAM-dependent methyltransferase